MRHDRPLIPASVPHREVPQRTIAKPPPLPLSHSLTFSFSHPPTLPLSRSPVLLTLLTLTTLTALHAAPHDGTEFFEKKIRPLLAEHCYECHSASAEKLKGKLRLDSREGMVKGGESGPAIVPGAPESSLLIKAVRYTDQDLQMPPKNKRLSDRQISDLTAWVQMGAHWPAADPQVSSRRKSSTSEIPEQDRAWWSFRPVQRPPLPQVKQKAWVANPIDAFVLAGLESKGLAPNPPATKRELARRACFDLIGLPPTPEQVAAFERDKSPQAYEEFIDMLLSLPQYGERWGRHWLDVARFAQSNGYERDGEKPLAWRYRDYVIKAFNEDKPYDRFILEQLAGDELPDATDNSLIATGFQRLGVWDDEPDDKRMAEFDELDDIVSTTGAAFLGLTMGCARCHDHKFDPIPQADYYRCLAFFRNIRPYENAKHMLDAPNFVPLGSPEKLEEWKRDWQGRVEGLQTQVKSAPESEKKKLQEQLGRLKDESPPFEWALAVRERGGQAAPTHVLVRGNAASPGAEVQPAFLSVLGGQKPVLPQRETNAPSTGRRLAFAEWIASPTNPLTARVMVNRVWQHHFGKGIVKTTTDFGHAGMLPTHPELLDWLAAEFTHPSSTGVPPLPPGRLAREDTSNGLRSVRGRDALGSRRDARSTTDSTPPSAWTLKRLHKLIMLSNTYRMSSRSHNPRAEQTDPANDLLWRQNLRRLEAEAIRDSILRVSGQLNPKMGGRGFFPHLGGEVLAGASRPGLDWERSSPEEQSRRSIYAYIRRTMLVPALDNFDYSNTTSPLGERPVTTVAPQALMLLNDEFMQRQAAAFSERLRKETGDNLQMQIQRGYELAFNRAPTKSEVRLAVDFLKRQAKQAASLQSRLTFRPDVPNSLSVEYLKQLQPSDFMVGPHEDWQYFRGRWSAAYEGIRTVDRQRGPFALGTLATFTNGVVEATLYLDRSAEMASLLLRSTAQGDEQRGYELYFDPRQQRVAVLRHGTELTTLAETDARLPVGHALPVKVELGNARISIWLGGGEKPVLDVTDPNPVAGSGQIGIRAWGATLHVEDLSILADGKKLEIRPALKPSNDVLAMKAKAGPARPAFQDEKALESVCLLLFNLNEFIYVD